MKSRKEVLALAADLKARGVPVSEAAWETALACEGWPYVFGAWGEECTPQNRRKRAREDHPTIVSSCQVLSGKKSGCGGCKWFPEENRVGMFDCRGFTNWVLKQFGITISGSGCTSQWNDGGNWDAKGTIDTVPEDVLVCLFVYKPATGKYEHTGFGYKGASVECSSGVQYFKKRKAKWTHWALAKGVSGEIPDVRPTLRRGDKGEYVTLLQTQLVNRGYSVGPSGIDGDYGRATEAAVKEFQKDNGLKVDGICGPATWAALDESSPTYYTVTIPHLRETQADQLIAEYTGATKTEEGGAQDA